ncbi:hypothetical protein BLNAU_11704 [Blattamonas nauphoetae]|uniref:Uncharacterized protein n=1 Tax=Blattamonas nauphoetae TaxID=2049346 RepID=A0ABQ9XQ02_9EUKA|nr:hypothetical protein BLNAU_11704 [Blattamonas nauphoetae]
MISTSVENIDPLDLEAIQNKNATQSFLAVLGTYSVFKAKISWKDLMEWFVEVVLFLDKRLKQWPSAPPLTSDDIRIDETRVACINPPPSTSPVSRENAFSSDLPVICELFLTALLILEDRHSLDSPPDPDDHRLIFARMMVDILDSFVASNDIVPLQESSSDFIKIGFELWHALQRNVRNESRVMSLQAIRPLIVGIVQQFSQSGQWIVPEHSLFRQKDVKNSTELVDVVKDALKQYSKEKVREEFDSFEGWKGLMRKIVANEETVCDISFLRNWIFRPTLTSLLSKHQQLMSLRPLSLPLPSAHLASSPTDHSLTSSESNRLPFNPNETDANSTLESSIVISDLHCGSSSSLTLSQTGTDPSSSSLSLEAQPPPSPDTQSSISPARSDTGWMISTLHNVVSAPLLQSSSQRSHNYPTITDVFQSVSLSNNLHETFNSSLFDEADDETIANSLTRCYYVCGTHRNLSHIDDPPAFVDRLVDALSSSNANLRVQSFHMLSTIVYKSGVEIVNESHLHNLRNAFRSGTKEEQTLLVWYWLMRFKNLSNTNTPSFLQNLSAFDFDGFLKADLSEEKMFALSIVFVVNVCQYRLHDPNSCRWAKDFLLRFEQHQNVLIRFREHRQTSPNLSIFDDPYLFQLIRYATLLSFDHGIAFPEELARILLNDQEHINHLPPSLYLNHTSLNPKYRRSVFPIELLFERQARSDPSAFLRTNTIFITRHSARFLHLPLFGLHSLLVRGLLRPLSDPERFNLIVLLSMVNLPTDLIPHTLDLFYLLPPPLILRPFVGPSQPLKSRPDVEDAMVFALTHLVASTTPFGDCLSLKRMFQQLTPLHPDDEEEVTQFRDCRDIVIALHWLNIPSRFDSPLLAHLPSIISSHPPSLHPSLFSEYGIHTLVTAPSKSSIESILGSGIFDVNLVIQSVHHASFVVRLSSSHHLFSRQTLQLSLLLLNRLMRPFPAVVSVTLEMFHRLVLTCSDEAKMKLVKHGLLDVVMVAVSQSSFLSDYESGIVVIGGLLESIHRMSLQKLIVGVDFSSLLTRWGK